LSASRHCPAMIRAMLSDSSGERRASLRNASASTVRSRVAVKARAEMRNGSWNSAAAGIEMSPADMISAVYSWPL